MGSVIAISPWLHDLYLRGDRYHVPCRQLMRTQILVPKRTGHILQLDTEYVRRRIAHSARFGAIAAVTVECVKCRWQAWLADWVRSVDLTPEQRAAILADNRDNRGLMMTAYLRMCIGSGLAAELMNSEHAPREETR